MEPLQWIARWSIAFALTQLVETPLYVYAQSVRTKTTAELLPSPDAVRPLRERIALAFIASAMTHPLLWFVFWPLASSAFSYSTTVFLGEALVMFIEGSLFVVFGLPRPYVWAILVNTASVIVGLVVRELFGFP